MSEEFVCAYCGMDLESPGEFHDIGSCAKYLRETRVKMRNEINALQTRIAELEAERRWIKYDENDPSTEPEYGQKFLFYSPPTLDFSYHSYEVASFKWKYELRFTHWMPLPEPPEVTE